MNTYKAKNNPLELYPCEICELQGVMATPNGAVLTLEQDGQLSRLEVTRTEPRSLCDFAPLGKARYGLLIGYPIHHAVAVPVSLLRALELALTVTQELPTQQGTRP